MFDNDTNRQISRAITKMEEALDVMRNIGLRIPKTRRKSTQIMKYISGSGNTTWKIYDTDEEVMYLRQSSYKKLVSQGKQNWMNNLDYDDPVDCEWDLLTVQDGDFIKIVQVIED